MGNSLFVIGSLIFTINCIIDIFTEVSIHSLAEFVAGLMFTVSSVLLMMPLQNK
jgi:hypothetical protein